MTIDRRRIIKAGVAAGLGWSVVGGAEAAEPVIGMIFPPRGPFMPPEAKQMYPTGVKFLSRGIGLPGGMTAAGYEEALPRAFPAALELKAEGAQGISVMGTSLTFYRGRAFNEEIMRRVTAETGLPSTTMSNAIVEGLKLTGAKRVSVATAYIDDVTNRLKRFLEEHDFEVVTAKGMGYERVPDSKAAELLSFCGGVYRDGPKADAMLISCGGLRTLDVLAPLEQQLGVPVVSSMPHALMNAVRLVGHSGRAEGFGRVLANV